MSLKPIGPEIPVNTTDGDDSLPQVVALAGGGHVIHWIDIGHISGDTAIKAQVHDANSQPIGSEITVGLNSGEGFIPIEVAALTGGGFAFAYLEPNPDNALYRNLIVRAYTDQGTPAGDAVTASTAVFGVERVMDIAALSNGGFVATWEDDLDGDDDHDGTAIKGQLFDQDGGTVGSEFLVNTDVAGDQEEPLVVALASERFAIAWSDEESQTIEGQVFLEDGTPFGDQFTFNPDAENESQLSGLAALGDAGFVATWYVDVPGGVFVNYEAAAATNNGTALGVKSVNQSPLQIFDVVLGNQEIVVLADGTFAIIWSDFGDEGGAIRARFFDADAEEIGNEIVLAEGENAVGLIDARPLARGGFVLARTDGDGENLFVDVFSETGASLGEPLVIPVDVVVPSLTGLGIDPDALAILDDGQVIVPWGLLGLDPDVTAQAFAFGTNIVSDGGGATASIAIDENIETVTTVQALDHGDPSLTYSIVGGDDSALFAIDPATGALSFLTAPDFEAPADMDADNIYEVVVETGLGPLTDSQTIEVTVTDIASLKLIGTKKKDTLTGAGDDDVLKGKNGRDTLIGENGDDLLNGGKKKDKLTGGEDADSFLFASKLKNKWADIITDFEVGTDSIHLDRDVFKKAGKAGTLKDKFFDTGKKADSKKDRILYDEKTGWLRYDEDGKGGDKAIKVARVLDDGNPVGGLSADDFMLV